MHISHPGKEFVPMIFDPSSNKYKYLDINDFKGGEAATDAFGRLRVSNPTALFDSKSSYDRQSYLWDEASWGNATLTHYGVASGDAKLRLSTSGSGDGAIRQTLTRMRYQPGKSQLTLMTFYAPPQTGVRKRIGAYEGSNTGDSVPQNGFFLEINGNDISFNIAKSGIITESSLQSDWDDPMDGTGPSAYTLDLQNSAQIMWYDYEWLGVGTARMGFAIDGRFIPCKSFHHANRGFDSVYTATPNLPLNYSIYQSGGIGGYLDAICASVSSEGGSEELGIDKTVDMGSTIISLSSTTSAYGLVYIRLKDNYDVTIIPKFGSAIATSANDTILAKLFINPTIAGSLTWFDLTDSAIQWATGNASNTLIGAPIWSAYASASSRQLNFPGRSFPRLGKKIDGTADILAFAVQPVQGNTDVVASFTWQELF